MRRNFLLILFALLLLGGCKKDREAFKSGIRESSPTFDVRVTSASISGIYEYRSDLKSVTVVYDKNSDFSSASTIPAEIHNCKNHYYYHVRLPDLEPGTTYYYYCIFDTGYGSAEGKQWSFTTLGNGGGGGGGDHAYVDLGLPSGLLWATCNVGADKPEDYGDYFAWGETTTKSTYDWDNYKWYNDGDDHNLTKYNTKSDYGTVDNKTVLELSDDAAHVNWGGGWRMPTREEMKELLDNCTWTWTTQSGKSGYRVTGSNGKSIFLPAAGYYFGGSLYDAGSGGSYWSSSLYTYYPSDACYLYFVGMEYSSRTYGRSVRPVYGSQSVSVPTVTTASVSNITQTTAICGGSVTSDGGAAVTARGVCWSTSQNPTVSDSHTADGSGTGSFTSNITGLTANTTYYVRAYATNSAGTSYGEQMNFTTQSGGGTGNHAYVDLGLPSGLLWATCNVGADSPEGYGWYFMWGSTTNGGDPDCTWANCPGNGGSSGYNSSAIAAWDATHLTNNVLNPEVDAASVNWGGDWRMPTSAEWQELYDNTTSTWTTENGVYGRKFEGDNGNYVFLPAAGDRYGTDVLNAGSGGLYWSSSLYSSDPNFAYGMNFSSGNVDPDPQDYNGRYYGFTVRPVRVAR